MASRAGGADAPAISSGSDRAARSDRRREAGGSAVAGRADDARLGARAAARRRQGGAAGRRRRRRTSRTCGCAPRASAASRRASRTCSIGRRGLIDRAARRADRRLARRAGVAGLLPLRRGRRLRRGGRRAARSRASSRRAATSPSRGGKLRRIGCPQGTFVGVGRGRVVRARRRRGGAARRRAGHRGAAAAPAGRRGRRGKRRMEHGAPSRDANKHAARDRRAHRSRAVRADHRAGQRASSSSRAAPARARPRSRCIASRTSCSTTASDFKPSRCLFVVPSEALARYVAGVLPALGVQGVPVTTFRGWARNLRKRLVPSAPDSYADETRRRRCRALKKHPALLALARGVRSTVELRGGAARARRAARRRAAARRGCSRRGTSTRASRRSRARARRARRVERGGDRRCRRRRAHAAEQALRKIEPRLGDVRRILFELLTDRGAPARRLRAHGVLEPAGAREIERAGALVRRAARGGACRPSSRASTRSACAPIDGLPLDDGSSEGGARAPARRGGRRAAACACTSSCTASSTRVDGDAARLRPHRDRRGAGSVGGRGQGALSSAHRRARRSVTIAGDVAQRVVFDNAFRGWEALLGRRRRRRRCRCGRCGWPIARRRR